MKTLIKDLIVQFFTWWNGQTWGTRFYTWRKGELVGRDEFGNSYYRERDGRRRWVIYNGLAEPSKVPADWHAWLHYTVDVPPNQEDYRRRPWQKPHEPNLTGTPEAYRPPGSILTPEHRPPATGDYEAWSPEES